MFWDGLFDSFGEETIMEDDYVRNCDDVGKLNNKTDHDSGIISDRYSDVSDDNSYRIKSEQEQCSVLSHSSFYYS